MKQFYGQMTKDELKGAVYSGDHLQEFADMAISTGMSLYGEQEAMSNGSLFSVSYDGNYYGFYDKHSIKNPENTIQWQPEPDEDLLKIVELCGGVWPDQALTDVIIGWKGRKKGEENNPDYVRLSDNYRTGQVYTREQFEAAKVYVERNREEMSPLDIAIDIMSAWIDMRDVKKEVRKTGEETLSKTPAIKNGSWINIKDLTEDQAQYCIDWLAERTGKESRKASEYNIGCVGCYKSFVYIKDCTRGYEHLEIKASDILPKDKPKLKTDQTVYNEYGSELTVYRVDEDKGVLCSDLQWYSPDDLITDEKVIAVYQDMIKLSKGVIKSSMVSNKEEVMQLAKALIADSSFEITLK